MNAWLISSLFLLLIWLLIWIVKPSIRKEMFWVSIFTMPLGLTEPLFVPEYWNPPSLFNLAARTGFDIESLIFCFAVGGLGTAFYELVFKVEHERMKSKEKHMKRHRFHILALLSPIIIFLPIYFLTNLNPIYSSSISMAAGTIAMILCRPDLKKKVFVGGLLFLGFYFVAFLIFNIFYSGMVIKLWNLSNISGILILGIPIEELMFAITFGGLWSGIYEHAKWLRVKQNGKKH